MSHDIVYPPGCRPVTDDLGPDELVRRLKTLAHTLQAMGQDEGSYQQYIPLTLHLAQEYFLLHSSRDVQLLIACCIADVLRVYAPEAPYKDPEQVKTIFLFLIKQLSGLKDPKDPAFKRYFYLLENLAYVKSFNMCFELDDCQEIFCSLFSLMFKIVNDEHSGKVKSFMLDVLCPLITESDVVSNELLDIILMNIVEPNKSQKKNAYCLAKELIVKCSDTLEPYIQAFFNHVLLIGKEEKSLGISTKVYDLIYELNHTCPSVLLAVLPQLEVKLKSTVDAERLSAVSLLARMFSETDSNLARHHTQLWSCFLGRFHDISVTIRVKCVQHSMHFLLNHPELRPDIIEALKRRQYDPEEIVRYEMVTAIVATARRDFHVVSESEDLLEFVKQRTLDKRFKIRKEAMSGLALIYKKHLTDNDVPQATKKAVMWIRNKILHGYYMTSIEDRLLVERLLNTCLVPFTFPAEERMKKLYYLVGTVDDHAFKAFTELLKHQLTMRRSVCEWLELHRKPASVERDRDIISRTSTISKFLPEPNKALEHLNKFSKNLFQDNILLSGMETVVQPNVSCKECCEVMQNVILKRLGQPVMTNLYYNTVKMLLERISSVMIDYEALKILIGYVEDCLTAGVLVEEIGVNPDTAAMTGLDLLRFLSFVFPSHFMHEDIIRQLFGFLALQNKDVPPLILAVFIYLGRFKPLEEAFPSIMQDLIPTCKTFATVGTPKQAKQAIRCLCVNMENPQDAVFLEILEHIKKNLDIDSEHYCTAIVALGHLAANLPEKYPVQFKNIVSGKIVRELLLKDIESSISPELAKQAWVPKDELPFVTLCRVEGLKTMARWLIGAKSDFISATKTFRMLSAFIINKGDLSNSHNLSAPEMAWLRLAAGCAMLKICEVKGVGDQFSAEQFYTLSQLMKDEVTEVRAMFAQKLHKGLARNVPQKCLPLDFMGFYALAGTESNRMIKNSIKQYMVADVNKRREYVKAVTVSANSDEKGSLAHIVPDYMLVFAIPVLAHSPSFTSYEDIDQLNNIRECLWFILEPLITKTDTYCFGFYKELLDKIKNHKDAVNEHDEAANCKLWAICDLAYSLLCAKTTNFDLKVFPCEVRIPSMHFHKHEDPMFSNAKMYIPAELQNQPSKKNVMNSTSTANNKDKKRPQRGNPAKKLKVDEEGKMDVEPSKASDTKIRLPGIEENDSDQDCDESNAKD